MDEYKLGAKFCREFLESVGVSIFVHDTLQCTNIHLDEFCKEQDKEACAVKINLLYLTILYYIYRPPTGNFLHTLDSVLNFLHNNTIENFICSDFNINYLNGNDKKKINYTTCYSHTTFIVV